MLRCGFISCVTEEWPWNGWFEWKTKFVSMEHKLTGQEDDQMIVLELLVLSREIVLLRKKSTYC